MVDGDALSFQATMWGRVVKPMLCFALCTLLLGASTVIGLCGFTSMLGGSICGPASLRGPGWLLPLVFSLGMGSAAARYYIRSGVGWGTLSVSRSELRLRRWWGPDLVIDIDAPARIVTYTVGIEAPDRQVAFVADRVEPPLLALDADSWPADMPAAIGEFLGIPIDELGHVSIELLRSRYPKNAKSAAGQTGLDTAWRRRPWQW